MPSPVEDYVEGAVEGPSALTPSDEDAARLEALNALVALSEDLCATSRRVTFTGREVSRRASDALDHSARALAHARVLVDRSRRAHPKMP